MTKVRDLGLCLISVRRLDTLLAELQDLTLQIIEEDSTAAVTAAEPEKLPPKNVG